MRTLLYVHAKSLTNTNTTQLTAMMYNKPVNQHFIILLTLQSKKDDKLSMRKRVHHVIVIHW